LSPPVLTVMKRKNEKERLAYSQRPSGLW
jgi:hypothetical protein